MDDKKERILDAAFERFKKFGFLKTTVDEIARLAQVGKGTIYFYFKNKEDILDSLVNREFQKGLALVAATMDRQPTAEGKLKAAIEVSFDYFHKNELVSKVMAMDQGFVLSAITKKNQELQKISMAGIRRFLKQGIEEGAFRELDVEKTAYVIDSLIRSFHYLHYLGLEMHAPHDLIETVNGLLLKGVARQ